MKEDRRITLTTKGNKKVMLLTQLVVLTGSQEEKLNCEQLLPELERIAKTLEIDWAVELSANIEYGTLAVSRIYEKEIGDYEFKSIEKATQRFLNEIDKLELPKPEHEPECPSHEETFNQEYISFVKNILKDINTPKNDPNHIIGAYIMRVGSPAWPFPEKWGDMPKDMLKEMCELYLKAHEQD